MDETFLSTIKDTIVARIAGLEDTNKAAADSRSPVTLDQQSVGRLSRMDAMQLQATAKASAAMRSNEIARLQSALKRIADGEYGYCDDCGDDIGRLRLERVPTAMKCLDCATG